MNKVFCNRPIGSYQNAIARCGHVLDDEAVCPTHGKVASSIGLCPVTNKLEVSGVESPHRCKLHHSVFLAKGDV